METDTTTTSGCDGALGTVGAAAGVVSSVVRSHSRSHAPSDVVVDALVSDVLPHREQQQHRDQQQQPVVSASAAATTPPFGSSSSFVAANSQKKQQQQQQQQQQQHSIDDSEEDTLNALVKHQQHARLLQGGAGRSQHSETRTTTNPDDGARPHHPPGNKATSGESSPKVHFEPSTPSTGKPPVAPGNPQSNASPDRLGVVSRKSTGSATLHNEAMRAGLDASGDARASSMSEGRQRTGDNHSWEGATVRFGTADDIGGRHFMEDCTIAYLDIREELQASGHAELNHLPDNRAFFGVFDGHDGVYAAAFAADHLLGNVLKEKAFTTHIPEALRQGFLATDQEYRRAVADNTLIDAGSTALTALVWGQTLYIANLGDCRAVLSRQGRAVQLSRDQDPSDCMERQRVQKAGGYICSDGRLCGELTVTRCIGDWGLEWVDGTGALVGLKEQDGTGPLIGEPEVTAHKLQEDDEFMVMACDGLWGVFSNERVIELARMQLQDHNDPGACARELVDMAKKQDATDNLSVVVVCFSESKPARRAPGSCSAMRKCVSSDGINRLGDSLRG